MKNMIKVLCLLIIGTALATGCGSKNDEEDTLEAAIHTAILEYNRGQDLSKESFACENHIILDKKEASDRVIVYAMVLYHEYISDGSRIILTSGSHMPTALTFMEKRGEYNLEEYWTPGDGEECAPSIKEKFPDEIYEDAIDTQKYVKEQIKSCDKQAAEHFSD